MNMLEVIDLRAGYEDILVLNGVSMAVPAGSVVSMVGPNGAGKSTLVKAIYGLADLRGGRVVYRRDGQEWDVTGWKPHRLTALGMNYVPQLDNVFPALSVLENLQIGAVAGAAGDGYQGNGRKATTVGKALEQVFETFTFLRAVRDRPAGALSGGQRQMLAIARALMSGPGLLFLDEPSAGLAPQVVDDLFERLQEIHAMGVAIVMVEQNARRALAMSDYGYVLEGGRNRYEGPGEQLLEDERVVELYLGRRRVSSGTERSDGFIESHGETRR